MVNFYIIIELFIGNCSLCGKALSNIEKLVNMNKKLIQVIYISRSTFLSVGSSTKIEPQVVQILSESKSNNRKNGLVGVLFFGDGCFFECLEGEEKEIDALVEVLKQDNRHKDLTIISRKEIVNPSFQKWSMKYVPFDASIKDLLSRNGYGNFDPYLFDKEMVDKVLKLLLIADDESVANSDAQRSNKNYGKWALFLPVVVITLYFMKLLISVNH